MTDNYFLAIKELPETKEARINFELAQINKLNNLPPDDQTYLPAARGAFITFELCLLMMKDKYHPAFVTTRKGDD